MKFKTFRALIIGGLCVVGGAASIFFYSTCGGDAPTKPTANATPETPQTAKPASNPADKKTPDKPVATNASPVGEGELRPLDKQTIERMQQGFPGDKVKDAFKGPEKVSLYKDPDGTRRVKIDLDRDEKWDEKWTFETKDGADKIKRQVATKDDEAYDLEYRLDGGRWVLKK